MALIEPRRAGTVAMRALGALARRLPPSIQQPLISLRASRFNFEQKAGTLRRYEVSFRAHPVLAAKYLLLDPEVDNFTYELANEKQLFQFLAEILHMTPLEVEKFAAEIPNDPELNRLLRGRLRRRLDRKHTPHFGRRVGWYVIARFDARRQLSALHTAVCLSSIICAAIAGDASQSSKKGAAKNMLCGLSHAMSIKKITANTGACHICPR